MKKEEAIKMLSNTKVYVDGKSKEIQEELFKIGFRWIGSSAPVFRQLDKPFLFLGDCLDISQSSNMEYFKGNYFREIKANDILSITIDKECEFKPLDRILVRNSNVDCWVASLFSYIKDGDFKFVGFGSCWRQCIPFEGNEHLLGTSDSPNEY